MKFKLSKLPYDMNALEPYISKRTLEFHHQIYHQTYIPNLNNLVSKTTFKNLDLVTIIKVADGPVFDNASQLWNHIFYFQGLIPENNNSGEDPFEEVIKNNFGTVKFFKKCFKKAAESLFGAGWIWLVLNTKGSIDIVQKSNAGNPLRTGLIPLLACDMWEHAYYLDYQNRRSDYIEAFWKLINWDMVMKRYNAAIEERFTTINTDRNRKL
jgi:superoxide dismutase, Fe-Mn family